MNPGARHAPWPSISRVAGSGATHRRDAAAVDLDVGVKRGAAAAVEHPHVADREIAHRRVSAHRGLAPELDHVGAEQRCIVALAADLRAAPAVSGLQRIYERVVVDRLSDRPRPSRGCTIAPSSAMYVIGESGDTAASASVSIAMPRSKLWPAPPKILSVARPPRRRIAWMCPCACAAADTSRRDRRSPRARWCCRHPDRGTDARTTGMRHRSRADASARRAPDAEKRLIAAVSTAEPPRLWP